MLVKCQVRGFQVVLGLLQVVFQRDSCAQICHPGKLGQF